MEETSKFGNKPAIHEVCRVTARRSEKLQQATILNITGLEGNFDYHRRSS